MFEMLKQLATPAIITGLISSLYAYFQKKKEDYRKYVYENKQENFKELVVYADELVDKGITNPDLEKLLFKISQNINPYGRKIKTFGKYQWIEDDGYIWYQIEIIEKKLASQILQIEDLKELAHRIQISKRLLDIKVEKGVVFINISDKMLFSSGSYTISKNAKSVLEKVAKVVKNKPDFEFMVEGHTDDVRIKKDCIRDNWDLSVMRATEIVRVLQNDFGIAPERMTAAGRSYYVPVASNTTAEGRAQNRRTRIVVLPKLDQFYTMIEEGMKDPAIGGKGK